MKIAVACGGTGGHVFPGLATARELLRRGHDVTLWLTGRETEQAARREWDGPVVEIPARGFPAGISLEAIRRGWNLIRAILRSCAEMRKNRPDVLLAMGSYASVGPCGAARLLGIPIVLHEANVIPGKAVRLFSRAATTVAAGFLETQFHLRKTKLVVVGIPLREELTEAAQSLPDRAHFPETSAPFRLLIAGGSLGAHRLNEVVTEALIRLKNSGFHFEVTHLTGLTDEWEVREKYNAAGVQSEVIGFTTFLAPLYHAADLAICRAGASTCAELAYFGVPALLVPFPLAALDHQTANARALEKRGAADLVEESALTPEWLESYLAQTLRQPERLTRLRAAARREGVQNGTSALSDLIEQSARATP